MAIRTPLLPFRRLALGVVLVAGLAAGRTRLQAQLADSSPFMPAETKAGAASQEEVGPVELRGILTGPKGAMFCIYDTAKKSGTWINEADRSGSITVRSFDLGRDSVVVDVNGRVMSLTLKQAKVASENDEPRHHGQPGMGGQYRPGGPVPTPADEAHRREMVIQEIQRRRMLRQQAMHMSMGAPNQANPGSGSATPGGPSATPQEQ